MHRQIEFTFCVQGLRVISIRPRVCGPSAGLCARKFVVTARKFVVTARKFVAHPGLGCQTCKGHKLAGGSHKLADGLKQPPGLQFIIKSRLANACGPQICANIIF